MNPITFMVLIVLSLLAAILLLFFAPGFLLVHGPLLVTCWSAGMVLYVACAYLWAWLEDVAAAREQEELNRWRASLREKHGPRGWTSTDLE